MIDKANGRSALAWAVHAFTASGAVLAFLALLAVERQAWTEALLWLFAALVVDGVDGSLARAARVRERLPRIDGDALDLVIDYLTYVFIPAIFLWRGNFLPPPLALPLCAGILVSALYVFARRDMKSDDGYFHGFPALWNVVVLYIFAATFDPLVSAGVVAALIVLTFAPVHVAHPFRVRDYGWVLPGLAAVWGVSTLALLLPMGDMRPILLGMSAASALIIVALGLLRTARGSRPPQ
ncbi:phosphatidylcholine/phosphatidylserine synthase [Sphingomonas lutea]|uniref:Phosphatidylcholine synthase n=1 Tax=Sphingomonas lutea TaxID=1045317 RepID=A0A7G9SH36_9SPHN|nr:CDP-alcohol phosphatidyltransferase family protein [Sphingomonas lutea]QNN67161.1 phosphatidylcholine/phosphatidylserine synthase [Sphingomonas lutea]